MRAEVENSSNPATRARFRAVRTISGDVQNHVILGIADFGSRVGRGIVEEPCDVILEGISWFRLLRGERAKGNEHSEVYGEGVV